EIGTLKALGFSRLSILSSFVLESLMLAIAGAAVGAVASLAMGGVKFSMINIKTWSEIVFGFDPNLPTIMWAVVFAVIMCLVGGFLPARRAGRLSPIEAMRS